MDSCSEVGNLIFCASNFHLTCHDPPLEDISKTVLWLCHTFTMKEKYAKQDKAKKELAKTSDEI